MKRYVLILLVGLTVTCTSPPGPEPVVAPAPVALTEPVVLPPPYDPAWDEIPTDEGLSAFQQSMKGDPEYEAAKAEDPYAVEQNDRAIVSSAEAGYYSAIRNEPPHYRGGWKRDARQGCQVARMGISEDTRPLRRISGGGTEGRVTEDHHGIMNVVQNNVKLSNGWLGVMFRLSPHVGRQKELTRPRQEWTSRMPCKGDAKPDGWDDDPYAGDWNIAKKYWPTYRDEIVRIWTGDLVAYMPGLAIAWGCRQSSKRKWCMDPISARRRGLCELPGYGERNGFWALPGNGCQKDDYVAVIPAALAAGKRVR